LFKKLRNKFILMQMATVTTLILLFGTAVIIFSYRSMDGDIRNTLSKDVIFVINESARPDNSLAFCVNIDSNGKILSVISPYELSTIFYENVVEKALNHRFSSGRINIDNLNLAYKINDNQIIFIDVTRELAVTKNLVYTLLQVMVPLIMSVFVTSLYFANRAIQPIEETFEKQKSFIADASHELKTPLATISANSEVLIKNADADQKKWLNNIRSESSRIARLLESMLYLAKVDYETSLHFQPINASALANEVLLPLEAKLYEENVELTTNFDENAVIHGDKIYCHRLLGILLDNAIKYSDGKIHMEIKKGAITVLNSGEPIPADMVNKLFDRFYRADKAREYTGGFGLGLAIAKTICDTHGWKITCSSNETSGTKFTITT